jgi:carbonic anhydrase
MQPVAYQLMHRAARLATPRVSAQNTPTMSIVSDILEYNRNFIERKEYESLRTDQFPNKKLVVLGCMDTRLVELLPRAMGFRNGDVKLVKNAGALVSHPFGSVMRSILLAIYELHAEEIVVVGHTGCGMMGLSCERVIDKARARGVSQDVLATLRHAGINLEHWLTGFNTVEDGVRSSVEIIRNHPLLPRDVAVHGMLMDSASGALKQIVDGYEASAVKTPG